MYSLSVRAQIPKKKIDKKFILINYRIEKKCVYRKSSEYSYMVTGIYFLVILAEIYEIIHNKMIQMSVRNTKK